MIKFHPGLGFKSKIFMRLKKNSTTSDILRSGQSFNFSSQMEASGPKAHSTKQRSGACYIYPNMQTCLVTVKIYVKGFKTRLFARCCAAPLAAPASFLSLLFWLLIVVTT